MRRSRAAIAVISAGLLALAAIMPAAAAEPGSASGWVKWKGEDGATKTRTSAFEVVDGTPGTKSWDGDSGWFSFTEKNKGSFVLDVSCVRVDGAWAEFAGEVTDASGVYTVGSFFLVSAYDSGARRGSGDEIGIGGRPTTLEAACTKATDKAQFERKGVIHRGDISVSDPR